MFTLNSEPSSLFSRIILSQAAFGVFGVAVLVAMLFVAFFGNATEENKLFGQRQRVKTMKSKPAPDGVVLRNLMRLGGQDLKQAGRGISSNARSAFDFQFID